MNYNLKFKMAPTMEDGMFSDVMQNIRNLINNPEIFHQPNPAIHENFKAISKSFYDRIVPHEIPTAKSKSLKTLLINGFDDEQVWQQLEIQNKNAGQHDLEESDDDEDYIDLFQNISDEDLDYFEDESNKKSAKEYMYADFYDDPEPGDENVNHADRTADLENEEIDSDDASIPSKEDYTEHEQEEEEQFNSKNKSKTAFEMEQENIKNQILEYEETLVTPKPWQLTGEVDISERPIDGLLNLPTDFELNAKPIVMQDKEFCENVENMIKITIKNKAYSDGVRQEKPVKEIINLKKEIVIDQTKSKKGLAEEYEELYLKKQNKQDKEENPKHQQIKKFMDSLFPELYALFSHIPKPAVPDIKIVSNLPAVTVEEVAPTSYSDVTLLAPEEIKKRTGLTKGLTERTETDRNRERRKKKLHQKMKQKKMEKEIEGKPISSKATKQEKLQVLKKLKQHKNTKIANVGAEKIKSSKDFFARLQETVSSKINKDDAKQSKKKKKV